MKKVVSTTYAPAAIGAYSQAMTLGNLVFTSGQLPLDPTSMLCVEGGITAQSTQSLHNLKVILDAAGAGLDTVIKTTCFLSDMNHFTDFNAVYSEVFGSNMPARSCVEVARLPKDALVEIEAIAYIKS